MKSPKIEEMVTISPTFAHEVNLKADFLNPSQNRLKLEGYVPNQRSREALRSIAGGFHPTSERRVHLITGTYGTGKSHFALVMANIVSRDIEDQEFAPLFHKIAERDAKIAQEVRKSRSSVKNFLLVLPEPHWDPEGFNHSLLTALAEALDREGLPFRPKTHFAAALERIRHWETAEPEATKKLDAALLRRNSTREQLVYGLETFKGEFFELFQAAHPEVAFGARFEPTASADPQTVLDETVRYLRSTGKWSGLFIIFDEFGQYLSSLANDPESFEGQKLQKLAEYCKRTGENQCHFMVIAHQTLADYAKGKRSQEEWQKIYGRFISGENTLTSVTAGNETEEMIDSIIHADTHQELWAKLQTTGVFNILTDVVKDRNMYPLQTFEWVERIVKGTYPLHPFATFALPWLSDRVGQSNRTLFTFLSDEKEFGLRRFVLDRPVFDDDGRPVLYTMDFLADYFEQAIKEKEEYRAVMQDRQDAIAKVGSNDLARRILNAIAVLQVIAHPTLPPTGEVITEALHVPGSSKHFVTDLLEELVKTEVLRFKKATKHYELTRRGAGELSVREAIQKERQRILDTGFDPLPVLRQRHPLEPILARKYKEKHFVDRLAARELVRAAHLANPKQYLDRVNRWYQPDRGRYEGDLLVLYVVAETQAEIQTAKEYASKSQWHSPHIVLAIPKRPVSVTEVALDVKAAENLSVSTLKLDPDELSTYSQDAQGLLRGSLDDFSDAANLSWYHLGNIATQIPTSGEEDYVSSLLESIFGRTPVVKDVEIANPQAGRKRADKLNAMKVLLETKGPFSIPKLGGSATDRILRATIKETELGEKQTDRGAAEDFEVRSIPPTGSTLSEVWKAMSDLLVGDRKATEKASEVSELVKLLIGPPYGLSNQLIEMLVAAFLRDNLDEFILYANYREFRRSKNRGVLRPVRIDSENVSQAIADSGDYGLLHFEVSPLERSYIQNLITVFPGSNSADSVSLWEAGKSALLGWFTSLPAVSRGATLTDTSTRAVVTLLADQTRIEDGKRLLKEFLPQALAVEVGNAGDYSQLLGRLNGVRQELDGHARLIETKLIEELCKSFGSSGKTQQDLDDALRRWYNALSESQRLHPFAADEAALKDAASASGPVIDRVLKVLPSNMGFGAYVDWQGDNTALFVLRVMQAKSSIEAYRPGEDRKTEREALAPQVRQAVEQVQGIFRQMELDKNSRIAALQKLLTDEMQ
jgi:hypothetical protein